MLSNLVYLTRLEAEGVFDVIRKMNRNEVVIENLRV